MQTPEFAASLALAGGLLIVLLTATLLLRGRMTWLIVGEDNRYSNSKFQMALWFLTLIAVYLAAVILRAKNSNFALIGGLEIPSAVLGLSGMSALTFAGAKQITVSRIDAAGRMALKSPSRIGPRFPNDLLTDDSGHRPDFGDFQMVIVTLLAVGVYLVQSWTWLTHVPLDATTLLPDVDTTILGTFGIGQGAYLAKKFAGDQPSN